MRSQGALELDSVHISFVLVSAAAIDTRIFHESTQSDEVRISSQIIYDIKFSSCLSIFFSLLICLYLQEFVFSLFLKVFSVFLKVWVLANSLLSEYSLNQITLPIYGPESGRALLSPGTSYFYSLHHVLFSVPPLLLILFFICVVVLSWRLYQVSSKTRLFDLSLWLFFFFLWSAPKLTLVLSSR